MGKKKSLVVLFLDSIFILGFPVKSTSESLVIFKTSKLKIGFHKITSEFTSDFPSGSRICTFDKV